MLSVFEAQNNMYLQTLMKEHQVQLKRFPDDVVQTLKTYAQEVLDDITAKDPMSKKVYDSYRKFQSEVSAWAEMSEKALYAYMS